MNRVEIVTKLDLVWDALAELQSAGAGGHPASPVEFPYSGQVCPLSGDDGTSHYYNSQLVFGLGCYEWQCRFCGVWESS